MVEVWLNIKNISLFSWIKKVIKKGHNNIFIYNKSAKVNKINKKIVRFDIEIMLIRYKKNEIEINKDKGSKGFNDKEGSLVINKDSNIMNKDIINN